MKKLLKYFCFLYLVKSVVIMSMYFLEREETVGCYLAGIQFFRSNFVRKEHATTTFEWHFSLACNQKEDELWKTLLGFSK